MSHLRRPDTGHILGRDTDMALGFWSGHCCACNTQKFCRPTPCNQTLSSLSVWCPCLTMLQRGSHRTNKRPHQNKKCENGLSRPSPLSRQEFFYDRHHTQNWSRTYYFSKALKLCKLLKRIYSWACGLAVNKCRHNKISGSLIQRGGIQCAPLQVVAQPFFGKVTVGHAVYTYKCRIG